jgi:hypothetical protein
MGSRPAFDTNTSMRRSLIAAAALSGLLAGCADSTPAYSGAVTTWRPVDVGRISVTYDVRNDGAVATRVGCILDAVIPSGNTIEKMSVPGREIRPGTSLRASDVIPIPDQGAFLVGDVTAGRCERFRGRSHPAPAGE